MLPALSRVAHPVLLLALDLVLGLVPSPVLDLVLDLVRRLVVDRVRLRVLRPVPRRVLFLAMLLVIHLARPPVMHRAALRVICLVAHLPDHVTLSTLLSIKTMMGILWRVGITPPGSGVTSALW